MHNFIKNIDFSTYGYKEVSLKFVLSFAVVLAKIKIQFKFKPLLV